ncbi:MAG: hypothetical protein QM662_16835, partial [Gordonia sp. (in: high G+C Gram-positive bacteria)]
MPASSGEGAGAGSTGVADGTVTPVGVSLRIGDHDEQVTYRVRRVGGRWLLDDALASVDLSGRGAIPGLTVGGVTAGDATVIQVFPGALAWGSTNPYLDVTADDVDGRAVVALGGDQRPPRPLLSPVLSAAGTKAVDSAVTAYLRRCAQSRQARSSADRPGCVQRLYRSARPGTVDWSAPSTLDALVRDLDPATPTRVEVFGSVAWTARYRATYGGTGAARVDQIMDGFVDLDARPVTYTPA